MLRIASALLLLALPAVAQESPPPVDFAPASSGTYHVTTGTFEPITVGPRPFGSASGVVFNNTAAPLATSYLRSTDYRVGFGRLPGRTSPSPIGLQQSYRITAFEIGYVTRELDPSLGGSGAALEVLFYPELYSGFPVCSAQPSNARYALIGLPGTTLPGTWAAHTVTVDLTGVEFCMPADGDGRAEYGPTDTFAYGFRNLREDTLHILTAGDPYGACEPGSGTVFLDPAGCDGAGSGLSTDAAHDQGFWLPGEALPDCGIYTDLPSQGLYMKLWSDLLGECLGCPLDDMYSSNDSSSGATSVDNFSTLSENVITTEHPDFFRARVYPLHTLEVYPFFSQPEVDLDLYLWSEDGTLLLAEVNLDGVSDLLEWTNTQAEERAVILQVLVGPGGVADGCAAYDLRFGARFDPCAHPDNLEPNDDCASAQELGEGWSLPFHLRPHDTDRYRVLVPALSELTLQVHSELPFGLPYQLRSEDCSTWLAEGMGGPYDPPETRWANTSAEPITVSIELLPVQGAECNPYFVSVSTNAVPAACAEPWGTGDSCDAARPIGPGTYPGLAVSGDSVDYFRYEVPAGRFLSVKTKRTSPEEQGLALRLWNVDCTRLLGYSNPPGPIEWVGWINESAIPAEVTVGVLHPGGIGCSAYELHIEDSADPCTLGSPPPQAPNQSCDQALQLAEGLLPGLQLAAEEDWYAVLVPPLGRTTVTVIDAVEGPRLMLTAHDGCASPPTQHSFDQSLTLQNDSVVPRLVQVRLKGLPTELVCTPYSIAVDHELPSGSALYAPYCKSDPNSLGTAAGISSLPNYHGKLTLFGYGLIPDTPALFLHGPEHTVALFGGHPLCIAAPLRRSSLLGSSADGYVRWEFDPASDPTIAPLSQHYFQCWYRDLDDPAGFNLTDGYAVVFP